MIPHTWRVLYVTDGICNNFISFFEYLSKKQGVFELCMALQQYVLLFSA